MAKTLVAYFSCSGVTRRVAQQIASVTGGDLFEIAPEVPYTRVDLDWTNKQSRSTIEMNDPVCRPAIAGTVDDMGSYSTVFVGFPIWWYREPSIIDTFLEAYDFSNATVVPFCTSASSGIGGSATALAELAGTGSWQEGMRFSANASADEVVSWLDGLQLA